jgi:site-specific DNA recombinase
MRAAIYARYSTENQREASLADQIRLCRERIAREGWTLVQVYQDRALSGASTLRPGYQALVAASRDGEFDVVLTEALDRLSRDQEDIAALFKRLRFAGVRIVTLSEGDISELHVGLKGTMNALYLRDLAQKTHRGLRGRVEAGRSGGGNAYGYAVVKDVDAAGNAIRGGRRIVATEAATVIRIFEMFVAGHSPIAIARALNAQGVLGPQGNAWRDTTIRGHALRGTGILRNELYVGQLVWNRMTFMKDPATGKRVSRMNAPGQQVRHEVPALRIIDQDLWERAQLRLGAIRQSYGADQPGRLQAWQQRRPGHLLTGKVFCGACGGAMSNIGRDYLACAAARRQEVCQNRRSIRRERLEDLILDALRDRLMQPEQVSVFTAEFISEWNRLQAEASGSRGVRDRELQTVTRKLNGLIDAIADGLRAAGLQAQLDGLEARRKMLEDELAAVPPPAPSLHPNMAEVYRARVDDRIPPGVAAWDRRLMPPIVSRYAA